jgi:hypothetical protein
LDKSRNADLHGFDHETRVFPALQTAGFDGFFLNGRTTPNRARAGTTTTGSRMSVWQGPCP